MKTTLNKCDIVDVAVVVDTLTELLDPKYNMHVKKSRPILGSHLSKHFVDKYGEGERYGENYNNSACKEAIEYAISSKQIIKEGGKKTDPKTGKVTKSAVYYKLVK